MLQCKWTHTDLTTPQQAREMLDLFRSLGPEIGAFDTETTGLHIIVDVPFLYQFGFVNKERTQGWTYLLDLEKQPKYSKGVIIAWHQAAATLKIYVAHNTKFDLHMMTNWGVPYEQENLSDTMFYIRYAHDNLIPAFGGPPLALKDYCSQFVDHSAKAHETLLAREKTAIAKKYNEDLKRRLKDCGKPPEQYEAKSYTNAVIDKIFSDNTFTLSDLEPNVREIYLQWFSELPSSIQRKMAVQLGLVLSDYIPYPMLNRENLYKYAHMDIVFCLEILIKLEPIIQARGQETGLTIDNSNILPLYEMERTGFASDKKYLEESRETVRLYIKQRREHLKNLLGVPVNIGQHETIKALLNEKFQLRIDSTNNDILEQRLSDLIRENNEEKKDAISAIETIQELRTLEKWYSAYIIRFLTALQLHERLYTTIGQVGTVSGRVVSDFQQFPKYGIQDKDGNELFHPRRIVKTSSDMAGIVYLDYSQIELRIQALYTILCGNPDLNLCRAYMPYKCYRLKEVRNIRPTGAFTKVPFDYKNPEHIKTYTQYTWYQEEDDTEWHPTDVHGATTTAATGLSPEDDGYKQARSDIGKRTNFAKNYGAELAKIKQMFPRKTDEECRRINDAYYLAFPGIRSYHEYCRRASWELSYTANLFSVKYYGVNGHKLKNLLIQGSAAYLFKLKIRKLWEFFKTKGLKSKFQMNIHDELSWELSPEDDPLVFFEIQSIMQEWEDTMVPIVAEMSFTKTTWADKKDIHTSEGLLNEIAS